MCLPCVSFSKPRVACVYFSLLSLCFLLSVLYSLTLFLSLSLYPCFYNIYPSFSLLPSLHDINLSLSPPPCSLLSLSLSPFPPPGLY